MNRGRKFYLNRREGKLWGVCAGLADYTGIDATLVRVGVVVLTLLGGFPWTLLAYGAAAWIAQSKGYVRRRETLEQEPGMLRGDPGPEREIDRRIAEIDHFVAHSNSRLAREFEELR